MCSTAKNALARSTGVDESGAAPEHGLSPDFDEEMEKLAREKILLRSGSHDIGA